MVQSKQLLPNLFVSRWTFWARPDHGYRHLSYPKQPVSFRHGGKRNQRYQEETWLGRKCGGNPSSPKFRHEWIHLQDQVQKCHQGDTSRRHVWKIKYNAVLDNWCRWSSDSARRTKCSLDTKGRISYVNFSIGKRKTAISSPKTLLSVFQVVCRMNFFR